MRIRPRLRRLARVALVVQALVATPHGARADDAAARQAFRDGVELYDQKRFREALASFETAYREKPSALIKQNIGLCHKAMGQLTKAAAAFDEALVEGETALKPETRAAITQELRELEAMVATLRVRAIDASGAEVGGVRVTVDGHVLGPDAQRRPIRLEPGVHVVGARAAGYAEPPEKKLALVAGAPVDATFELTREAPKAPVIEHLPASAGRGAKELPPAYSYEGRPQRPPPPMKRLYIVPTLALAGQSLHLGEGAGEGPGGKRRGFAGAAIGVRGGFRASRFFALEARLEVGQQTAQYALRPGDPIDTETGVTHWQLTPGLRFATTGSFRFTVATGAGLHGVAVASKVYRPGAIEQRRGSGLAASWLVDTGAQIDVGPVMFEGVVFAELHGVSHARDQVVGERMLLASPSTRMGARLGVLVPF